MKAKQLAFVASMGFLLVTMKRITIFTVVVSTLLSAFSYADHFETLAGYRDSIDVAAGEVALILFVTDSPTLQYKRPGKYPVQFRLGKVSNETGNFYTLGFDRQEDNAPSAERPLALVGPAKVSLMTDGVVSIRIVTYSGDR